MPGPGPAARAPPYCASCRVLPATAGQHGLIRRQGRALPARMLGTQVFLVTPAVDPAAVRHVGIHRERLAGIDLDFLPAALTLAADGHALRPQPHLLHRHHGIVNIWYRPASHPCFSISTVLLFSCSGFLQQRAAR
ncbi:hypothetical protein [Rubritalea halochordaticola]|uniref:hypothetical protein n=1 Tax=Rubritalea halochordaticola TaxID=714537 RepID=UPI0031FBEBB7